MHTIKSMYTKIQPSIRFFFFFVNSQNLNLIPKYFFFFNLSLFIELQMMSIMNIHDNMNQFK